jgi:acyl-CoA hydrolase
MSEVIHSAEECVDRAIAAVGTNLKVMAPLGLGKPVQLMNAFYRRALADPAISLHIYTALCLELPKPASPIEASLAGPIIERLFGDYEELEFMSPQRSESLPANVQISELYFKAGSMKKVAGAQRNYISSNYTHIARDAAALGANVLLQLVAVRGSGNDLSLSLSCNPDTSLDLVTQIRAQHGRPFIAIAQTHDELPYMENDAEVGADFFDLVLRDPACNRTLFGVPNTAVPLQDYAAALHASGLIVDGGTLQIGIGALGDAVAHAAIMRQEHNDDYRAMVSALTHQHTDIGDAGEPFADGLYVSTEMFVNGMMHLMERGIVKRKVYDSLILQEGLNNGVIGHVVDQRLYEYARAEGLLPARLDTQSLAQLQYWGIVGDDVKILEDGLRIAGDTVPNDTGDAEVMAALLGTVEGRELRHGRVLHGGFFLGPRDFYQKLRELDSRGQEQICMTSVMRTNQLLQDYPLYCAQRRNARFINTGMIATLSGAVASDALEDGTVISGVGGQYNFVAMAQDLPGARSVLCIRSTRGHGKQLCSNILPFYGHTTIPRHLRDVIVTEYGVADLRARSDEEIIRRMINIADSRYQQELADFAIEHGKLPRDYRIPAAARDNTPEKLQRVLGPYQKKGLLPAYPFGTDLTEQEITLGASLRRIKQLSEAPTQFMAAAFRALLHHGDEATARPFLERIQLEHPDTPRDYLIQQLLLLDLEERGQLKAS